MKTIKEGKYFAWKKRGYELCLAEALLEEGYALKGIKKREKNRIKKQLNKLWVKIWYYYPDKNPSIETAFKQSEESQRSI